MRALITSIRNAPRFWLCALYCAHARGAPLVVDALVRDARVAVDGLQLVALGLPVLDDPRQGVDRGLLGRGVVQQHDHVLHADRGAVLGRDGGRLVGVVHRAVAAGGVPVVVLVAARLHVGGELAHDA